MTEPGGEAASEAGPNVTEGGAHDFAAANRRAQTGNLAKEAEKLARQRKLFVRDRLGLLAVMGRNPGRRAQQHAEFPNQHVAGDDCRGARPLSVHE